MKIACLKAGKKEDRKRCDLNESKTEEIWKEGMEGDTKRQQKRGNRPERQDLARRIQGNMTYNQNEGGKIREKERGTRWMKGSK